MQNWPSRENEFPVSSTMMKTPRSRDNNKVRNRSSVNEVRGSRNRSRRGSRRSADSNEVRSGVLRRESREREGVSGRENMGTGGKSKNGESTSEVSRNRDKTDERVRNGGGGGKSQNRVSTSEGDNTANRG